MADIRISFSGDQGPVDNSIDNLNKSAQEILDELQEKGTDRIESLQLDSLNLVRDLQQFEQLQLQFTLSQEAEQRFIEQENNQSNIRITELRREIVDIEQRLTNGTNIQQQTRTRYETFLRDVAVQEELIAFRNRSLESRIQSNEQQLEQQEKRTFGLSQKLSAVSAGISAAAGFLSLYQALVDDTEASLITTAISLTGSLVAIALTYGTLAAASGNIALLAAAGATASSAASIINTLRSIGRRNQSQINMQRRRDLNRSNN